MWGSVNVDDARARLPQPLRAARPERLDLRRHAVEPVFPGDADRQAFQRAADRCFVIGDGLIDAGRIPGVGARQRSQHDRRVAHGARDRARLIQRRSERDHAVARAASIGRLDPDGSGERGGLTDRAAGVARRRREAQPRGDRGGRAARRPARRQQSALIAAERHAGPLSAPIGRQPRRGDRTIIGGLVRRAHRELVHVQLAQHHRAVAPEVGGDGRLVRRLEAVEDVAARLSMDVPGRIEVLDADRQPLERPTVALGQKGVARSRLLHRVIGGDRDKRVDPFRALDRVQMRLRQFGAGDGSRFQSVASLGERQGGEVGQFRFPTKADARRRVTPRPWGRGRTRPPTRARWRGWQVLFRRRSRCPRA